MMINKFWLLEIKSLLEIKKQFYFVDTRELQVFIQ